MRIDTSRKFNHADLETPIRAFTDPCPYSFHLDQTVEEVLLTLQSRKTEKNVEYFYITDKKNILKGVISLTDLLYNPAQTPLENIVDNEVITVLEDESLEKGLQRLAHHQLLILPVVNRENRLVGVLEIILNQNPFYKPKKIHNKYIKEDVFQFIGFSIEQRKWTSPWTEYRLRMPWLLCNLVGGLTCAVISRFFKLTLEQFVILAFFIPLVLTLSESVSIQSMTLSLRFLHIRKIHIQQVVKRAFVEIKSSLMLGITSAVLIAGFYFIWNVDVLPMVGIGISVISAMVMSALFGALFPVVLHVLHLDPKVAAGPVVLMVADVVTISLYLVMNTYVLM